MVLKEKITLFCNGDLLKSSELNFDWCQRSEITLASSI